MYKQHALERPCLKLGLSHAEELGCIHTVALATLNAESELLVWLSVMSCFTPINWGVYFQSNIEVLPWKEIGLVRRKDAAKSGARSETLESLTRCFPENASTTDESGGRNQHGWCGLSKSSGFGLHNAIYT